MLTCSRRHHKLGVEQQHATRYKIPHGSNQRLSLWTIKIHFYLNIPTELFWRLNDVQWHRDS